MNQLNPGHSLSDAIVELIAHITAPLGNASRTLVQQAASATVTRSSATMIDIVVSSGTPLVDIDDGPTPGQALVYDGDQLQGEILVWLRSGFLIALEQAWYTDEPPRSWPSPAKVRVT